MVSTLVSSLIVTYFASRLLLMRTVTGSRTWALIKTHILSLAVVIVVLVAIRLPLAPLDWRDYAILVPAQFFWLCLDGLRRALFRGRNSQSQRTA